MEKHTIDMIIGAIAVLGGLGIGAIAVYIATISASKEKVAQIEAKNKERLALIEKGMDLSVLDKKPYQAKNYTALLWGLLLGGIGFGALIGYLVSAVTNIDHHFAVHCFGLIFGGIGLVAYFVYKNKSENKR